MNELGRMRLIVNPRSGNGQVRTLVPRLRAALDERGCEHDVVETGRAADAGPLARAALDEGIRYLVAVGGDGTVHEVVNGMFDGEAPVAPEAVLGVAGGGSGCDFARSFGLDRAPEAIAKHLATPHTMQVDVGVAEFAGVDGPQRRLFVNIAEVGYGAEVVRRAALMPRWFGRVRYLLGAWGAIRAVERQTADIVLGHATQQLPLVELVIANGQFFGGGMKVAPRALPDDGKFNVLAFTGKRSQVFMLTTQLFQGEHLPHPQISEWQSPTVELAPDRPMRVEADGELLGSTPARFWLLPGALRLKI